MRSSSILIKQQQAVDAYMLFTLVKISLNFGTREGDSLVFRSAVRHIQGSHFTEEDPILGLDFTRSKILARAGWVGGISMKELLLHPSTLN